MDPQTARYLAKGMATVAAAALCGLVAWQTKGEHGAGWFIASLIFIW